MRTLRPLVVVALMAGAELFGIAAGSTASPWSPRLLQAQDIPTMIVRVASDEAPIAGIELAAHVDGQRRSLGSTGESGLAIVEFARAPFPSGARIAAVIERCGETRTVWFVVASLPAPATPDECRSHRSGSVIWGRTERATISLDETGGVETTVARRISRARTGLRVHAGPHVGFVQGDDLDNTGFGVGGELGLGTDFQSGFGIGFVAGLMFHDLKGLDELLLRWSFEVEPRYQLGGETGGARPYVAGRLGYQVLDAQRGSGLLTEKGWGFGPGIGVVLGGPAGIALDLGARFTLLSVSVEGFDRSGSIISLGGALRF